MFSHKAFTKNSITLGLCVSLMGMILCMQPVSADITIPSDYGIDTVATNANLEKEGSLPVITGRVVGAGLSFIGVAFFILMVYAGFLWMTAHGNEEQVKKAQSTLIGATIGMLIVLGSYAITKFIFESVESTAGGGNGGAPETDERCRAKGNGFSCKQIQTCIGIQEENVDAARRQCEQNADSCALNICPGAANIVCCK